MPTSLASPLTPPIRHCTPPKFHDTPIHQKQARFAGRMAGVPDIDLDQFHWHAEIDWIDLTFSTGWQTQFQWIKQNAVSILGGSNFVTPLDPGPGNVTSDFTIRIQAPKSLATIAKGMDELLKKFGATGEPLLTGLELSIDAYPLQPTQAAREALYGVATRTFFAPRDVFSYPRDRPRFVGPDTKTKFVVPAPSTGEVNPLAWMLDNGDRLPSPDATFYIGAKEADVSWRIQHKITDKRNNDTGVMTILEEEKKRVRVEVTLGTAELSRMKLNTLEDLAAYRMPSMQGSFFHFMLPTFMTHNTNGLPLDVVRARCERIVREKFEASGILGLQARGFAKDAYRRFIASQPGVAKLPQPRVGAGNTDTFLAYEALNMKVRRALENLGRRLGRDWSSM